MKSFNKSQEDESASGETTKPVLPGMAVNPAMFYEEVLTNIPADIAVFNTRGEYIFINSAAIKDESTRKWLIGKTIEDYCILRKKPTELAANRRAVLKKAIETKQLQKWERHLHSRFVRQQLPDRKRPDYPVDCRIQSQCK